MSNVATLGSALAYTNAAQGKMELGATLTKMAHNSDTAMAGLLDSLVQKGMESGGSAPQGMGQNLDIKA
ncbi:hypothetical protein [Cohaesibacter celericrescens]|uniref:Motility protein n=1 Tax=Cohaesibacter celericrescens TaxID=2067669 RepID=A0A2N5XU77_9HYPH|nr:hypothetical protein [Cohaesibacter celericrescens]PLW78063.1 hypothetical protein C0081_06315 [Cohaesibacter celericrescens]